MVGIVIDYAYDNDKCRSNQGKTDEENHPLGDTVSCLLGGNASVLLGTYGIVRLIHIYSDFIMEVIYWRLG